MKTFIFLSFIVAVVSVLVWRMRKSQAEAAVARREEIERRKKQEKEALTPELDMIWPVIIRPVKGDQPSSADCQVEEPSMTTIEYKPPEQATS
jgi:hypothetical protein